MSDTINFYDIAYGLGVALASPIWLGRAKSRRKVLRAFAARMGRVAPRADFAAPAVMIHAVSLGEMNATRALVDRLRARRPDLHVVISTTTDTGFARGLQLYGESSATTLIRYPLDFTAAITRLLDAMRPSVIVLMELELWPNFLRACEKRGIAVMLANGRLTESSFKKYRLIKPIIATMLRRLARLCVQDELYAARFIALGAAAERVRVDGTMKFDNATVDDHVPGDSQLAADLGLKRGDELIWVCGSTGPGEEEILLSAYRGALKQFSNLRLVIVPRKPERFDDVAALIQSAGFNLIRRSQSRAECVAGAVVLGDTMGELRKFYSLADVVFVGRSLVDLGSRQHGSDMIEPAALAKPVIVGPFTGNFAEAVRRFLAARAMIEVRDESSLLSALSTLLTNVEDAKAIGLRAQAVVRSGQGATDRHAQAVIELLDRVTQA